MACFGYFVIYIGVILGILDWVTDIIYVSQTKFNSSGLRLGCLVFIFVQPLWYIFLYVLYVGAHSEIKGKGERLKKLCMAPLYSIL